LRETTAWMQEVEQRREQLPRAGVRVEMFVMTQRFAPHSPSPRWGEGLGDRSE
jgi:hypothetical protein